MKIVHSVSGKVSDRTAVGIEGLSEMSFVVRVELFKKGQNTINNNIPICNLLRNTNFLVFRKVKT